jgi:hypothetical protein
MNLSLLNPFQNFNNLRFSLGITMMFNGFPMIFFIRDTLRIGPASGAFTAMFFALAFVLMLPNNVFQRIYKPNIILLNLGLGFLLVTLYYFFFFNRAGKSATDMGYFFFIFGFIVLLLHIPNDVKDTLVLVLFLYSLFCNITLVYSLLTNPAWSPGMRAAVSFANDGAQEGGNPHMTARNGVICIVSAMVLMPRISSILVKLLLSFSVLFSLGIVVLSLAKSSYIGIGLMCVAYFLFKFRIRDAARSMLQFFKFKNFVVVAVVIAGIRYFLNAYLNVFGMLLGYWNMFENKIWDIAFTALGVKLTEKAELDASAMGRVNGFDEFMKTFFSRDIFMGRGYRSVYLDVPILESFVAEGIPGFIFFSLFNLFLYIYAIREIRRGTNSLTTFLAFFAVSMSILLVTGGQPTEIAFWFPYAVFIRFLGIKYIDSRQPSYPVPQVEPTRV